jgi:ferric-dicitrate binding protein FerR (iron transport regulator)
MRIAAMIVILLGGSLLFYMVYEGRNSGLIVKHSGGNVITDTLPDGSVVTLNKNSSLSYDKHFNGDSREITLEGEAFFDVTPDRTRPFLIHVNDVSVRVVGTSFNVRQSAEQTEVIVETGVVEVARDDHMVKLNPDEKAVVAKDGEPLKQASTDDLYNYYRTRSFVCRSTPLWRLADVLGQAYGVEIVIPSEQVKQLQITASFQDEPLDNILKVVAETFSITVEKKNGQVILR